MILYKVQVQCGPRDEGEWYFDPTANNLYRRNEDKQEITVRFVSSIANIDVVTFLKAPKVRFEDFLSFTNEDKFPAEQVIIKVPIDKENKVLREIDLENNVVTYTLGGEEEEKVIKKPKLPNKKKGKKKQTAKRNENKN